MFSSTGMRKIAWVLCVALLVLRVGGAHAHVHLHFGGGEPAHGAHMHVHTGAGVHQEPAEEHSPHFELDAGVQAELLGKKPAGPFDIAAPLVLLVVLLIATVERSFIPRRRPMPIRVLSVFAIRPLLRAPPA